MEADHVFVFETPPQLLTLPDFWYNRMCCYASLETNYEKVIFTSLTEPQCGNSGSQALDLHSGHLADAFIQSDLQPFIHTFRA